MNIIPKAISSRFQKFYGQTGYIPSPFFAQALSVSQIFGGTDSATTARGYALDPTRHVLVASCVRLLADTVAQTRFLVKDKDDHVASAVLNRPAHISKAELIHGIVEGMYACGSAYLIPESDQSLRLVDWRNMKPPKMGAMFYEEKVPMTGKLVRWPMNAVIHLRFQLAADGVNGVSPLANSVLGDIMTDIQAQGYTNTMLKNLGVPGLIASPKSTDPGDMLETHEADALREQIDTQVSGENLGKTLAVRGPIDVFEPKGAMGRVDMRDLRATPEERIHGAMGVHPALLAIGKGSENSQQAATMEHIQEFFIANTVEPLVRKICEQLTVQLLPFYSGAGVFANTEYTYDLSGLMMYAAMKRKVQMDCIDIANNALTSGFLTEAEWRKIAGFDEQ